MAMGAERLEEAVKQLKANKVRMTPQRHTILA